MNHHMRTNLFLVILISLTGNFLFLLLNISIDTLFNTSNQKSDYIAFYTIFCLAAFAIGSLCAIDSPNHRYWKIGISLLLISNLICIAFGSIYTFDEQTEEFILYFLGIQLAWLLNLFILGMYLRYLFRSTLIEKQKNRIIIVAMISLFLVQILREIAIRAITVEIIYFLVLTSLTIGIILILSFKAERPTPKEEDSKLATFKKSGIRTSRIVTVALAIIISIFFVVYANIQTSYAKEQEWISNQLRNEAIKLQEAAQREAERVLTENAELERQLEECRGGK